MFDLGIQELIVIFIVALIVFGPERLPEIGTKIGQVFNDLKKSLEGVKAQVNAEMQDIKDPLALKDHLYGKANPSDSLIHPEADPLAQNSAYQSNENLIEPNNQKSQTEPQNQEIKV